jgi:hypothetical protein
MITRMKYRYMFKQIILLTTLLIMKQEATIASGGDLVRIKDLHGSWKFSIGERDEWKSPKFDDQDWDAINVPSPWEDQGFNGYNGYATYRKSLTINSEFKDRMLFLLLGYIDDVDEVFFNGQKIGSTGSFPPKYETAYNAERKYYIPCEIIHYDGTNVITVVVYDSYEKGGIVSGEIGIFSGKMSMNLDINLQGKWKFRTGDDINRKAISFDDSGWDNIFVPSKWEDQRYRDYDGYAWYRKAFDYAGSSDNAKMVLVLGKIDDVDQVFINGVFVGSTGSFPLKEGGRIYTSDEWSAFRGYYIPDGVLKKGQANTIAVRVYDSGGGGGIYEGPVGLISQIKYIEFWRKNKNFGWNR